MNTRSSLKRKRDANPEASTPPDRCKLTSQSATGALASDDPQPSSAPQPLTFANLARFDSATSMTESIPSPSSSSSASTRTNTSRELLRKHNLFIDRGRQLPHEVQGLVERIKKPRTGRPTPKSKKVVTTTLQGVGKSERWLIHNLADLLGYPGENEGDGEKDVDREMDMLFNNDTLPLASSANAELQRMFQLLDRPSTAKPDISYGYPATAFEDMSQMALSLLPDHASAFKCQPWCPYWLVEWKGPRGTEEALTVQVCRDGASTVNALHNMYDALKQPSSVVDTVVFTSAVSNGTYFIRCHWMDRTDPERVSFEAEKIGRFFLDDPDIVFQLRSMVLNILDWARGERLDRLKDALAKGRHFLQAKGRSPRKSRSPTKQQSINASSAPASEAPDVAPQLLATPPGSTTNSEPEKRAAKRRRVEAIAADVVSGQDHDR